MIGDFLFYFIVVVLIVALAHLFGLYGKKTIPVLINQGKKLWKKIRAWFP